MPLVIKVPACRPVAVRQAPRLGRSVRSQRFRFTQWPDGSEELYDHSKDPYEWTNLAGDTAMSDIKTRLAASLPAADAEAKPTSGDKPKGEGKGEGKKKKKKAVE